MEVLGSSRKFLEFLDVPGRSWTFLDIFGIVLGHFSMILAVPERFCTILYIFYFLNTIFALLSAYAYVLHMLNMQNICINQTFKHTAVEIHEPQAKI